MKRLLCLGLSLLLLCPLLSSCRTIGEFGIMQEWVHYTHEENYVTATGNVSSIYYNEETDAIYLSFINLSHEFEENSFMIAGKNLEIVQENHILKKIRPGDEVEFISTDYFGPSYIFQIVAISVNGEELLSYEDGVPNLLTWIRTEQSAWFLF